MALIHGKSQKSFEKNIKTEMASGKPQKQALAIAYAVKRKAQHKAHGGELKKVMELQKDEDHEDVMRYGQPEFITKEEMDEMAEGGEVESKGDLVHIDIMSHKGDDEMEIKEPKEEEDEMEGYAKGGDIVSRIMRKHYSKGGVVANEGMGMKSHMAGGKPNNFDVLVLNDKLEHTQKDYGDSLGNAREAKDREDIIEKIMRKRAKQHNPKVIPE